MGLQTLKPAEESKWTDSLADYLQISLHITFPKGKNLLVTSTVGNVSALKKISASLLVFQISLFWFLSHRILLVWHILEVQQNVSSTDWGLSCFPEFLWPHFFAHIFFCHCNKIWLRREAELRYFTCYLQPQVKTLLLFSAMIVHIENLFYTNFHSISPTSTSRSEWRNDHSPISIKQSNSGNFYYKCFVVMPLRKLSPRHQRKRSKV